MSLAGLGFMFIMGVSFRSSLQIYNRILDCVRPREKGKTERVQLSLACFAGKEMEGNLSGGADYPTQTVFVYQTVSGSSVHVHVTRTLVVVSPIDKRYFG